MMQKIKYGILHKHQKSASFSSYLSEDDIVWPDNDETLYLLDVLDDLGELGWQLVSVLRDNSDNKKLATTFIFSKPVAGV